ncbi:response regulator transcription factor [Mucilaginibacter limnophilus]|uniref:Response regulator transcription factor n=1 Tax=Mucilaginibacter limnophilus TaxID=1932778 RepID=A0A437MR58_9SPHI|nr:response regulator transcription factor [Mucilaginibacter limnophilus]RVU00135.1 response regulator transcription factor [Mucilaginibacter limnophilus]
MEPLRLYIVDDHQILIDGLSAFFSTVSGIEIVGTANNSQILLQEVHLLQPDILLLDLNMPKMDGMATLDALQKDHSRLKVIVLSSYHQSYFINDARKKGAKGYLLKNGSKTELLNAIEAVAGDGTWFPESGISEAADDAEKSVFTDDFKKKYQLTRREIEIIKLIAQGLTSNEIGEKLFIAENTVTTHRRNILLKLEVKNTGSLLNFARQQGII